MKVGGKRKLTIPPGWATAPAGRRRHAAERRHIDLRRELLGLSKPLQSVQYRESKHFLPPALAGLSPFLPMSSRN